MSAFSGANDNANLIHILDREGFETWISTQDDVTKGRVQRLGFTGKAGQTCMLPEGDVLVGRDVYVEARWTLSRVAAQLKSGTYALAEQPEQDLANGLALSWALADYAYRPAEVTERALLVWPENADRSWVEAADKAYRLVRNLISAPTNLMGPENLADAAMAFEGANVEVTAGEDLLTHNFPAIHAVGRAANEDHRAPRLIDLKWGDSGPKIVLVGKGVCFDTGGLDLKGAAFMRTMKKDMGGAAHVLGLASMIMDLDLPVQLRVLIPAVENSVAGNAFRPGDVIDTRQGLTVEIGNTDAEGRLVLADALTYACEEEPDLVIDYATLTGAARVAMGPDVPAVFTNDDRLAALQQEASDRLLDPTWRLPLHQPYAQHLSSKFADLNNISETLPQGGAITAALFLEKFVTKDTAWMHLDVMAWNTGNKPGRPKGGEAMGMLATFAAIRAFLEV